MTRMRLTLALLVGLTAPPAAAQPICEDLWFTRNAVMDRAGYCFASRLGRALFDNADCTGPSVALSPSDKILADEIRRLEEEYACRVDTSRTGLDLPDLFIRRELTEFPIRDAFETGCIGYRSDPLPLYAGRDRASPVVGQVLPGDSVGFSHYGLGGGNYVTTHPREWGPVLSGGWLLDDIPERACDLWAG